VDSAYISKDSEPLIINKIHSLSEKKALFLKLTKDELDEIKYLNI